MLSSVLTSQPNLFTQPTSSAAPARPITVGGSRPNGNSSSLFDYLRGTRADLEGVRGLPHLGGLQVGLAGGGGAAAHATWRRGILEEHSDWHDWQRRQVAAGNAQSTYQSFFTYHRGLLARCQADRQANGLPPLQGLTPPARAVARRADGSTVEADRPNPNDARYRGNFNAFAADMVRYHNIYHLSTRGTAQDISNADTAPLRDNFYQFHIWVEQQYQAWRTANP